MQAYVCAILLAIIIFAAHALRPLRTSIRHKGWKIQADNAKPLVGQLHAEEDKRPLRGGGDMEYRSDYPPYSAEWAAERGMEPGYGGVWPGNPEAETFKVTVISRKTNETFITEVAKDRYIYYAFEEKMQDLPVVNARRMCRQGCCTICAAKIVEGKVKMDAPLGLLKELRGQQYGLMCCAMPRSDVTLVLQDEDEMYIRQWAEGFEGGGTEWGGFFLDED